MFDTRLSIATGRYMDESTIANLVDFHMEHDKYGNGSAQFIFHATFQGLEVDDLDRMIERARYAIQQYAVEQGIETKAVNAFGVQQLPEVVLLDDDEDDIAVGEYAPFSFLSRK